ncbi:MAG: helix-turn-helix domain-containing protein [Acetobacteraceae bacterium]|nr:helix-turn-helix domain-containing protein [Acetobacteraceae bacterium]
MNGLPTHGVDATLATLARSGSRAVRLALAALRAALEEDPAAQPTLAALAAAAGTSPRSLQREFAATLGLSPLAVGRRLRLAAARQMLARGQAASVLEAALHHGFEHPGRFAIAYARAFDESPSITLRSAPRPGGAAPASGPPVLATIELRRLTATDAGCAPRAGRATNDLAIAICRAQDLALADRESARAPTLRDRYRLSGSLDRDEVVLELAHPWRGIVVWTARTRIARHGRMRWADHAVSALRAAIEAELLAQARRTPLRIADVDSLVRRARPAAMTQELGNVRMALDLLNDALYRDPAHARAHALSGWIHATTTGHGFWNDPDGGRARALDHGHRALTLAPDDADVVALVGNVMTVTHHLDEGERLLNRALALNPARAETWLSLGVVQNIRGDGRRAAAYHRRFLALRRPGNDPVSRLPIFGITAFINGDYPGAVRLFTRALEQQPGRLWPHRLLAAALVQLGERSSARRSVDAVRHGFPECGLELFARSASLHRQTVARILDGLEAAGMPP